MKFQYTKHFELINYSSYGTYVNNILYSNNLTERSSTDTRRPVSVEAQVREIVDRKRKVSRSRRPSFEGKMTAVDCLNRMECSCTNTDELRAGWEGSAVLNHGSLLRFGCVSFVFSIVDCAGM